MPDRVKEQTGDRIAIARVLAPFGIKGFNRVLLFGDDPERLSDGLPVLMGAAAATAKPDVIETVLLQGNGTMVKFASVPDRTAAERITGLLLFVEQADALKPKRGAWFIHDIIGCTVQTAEGTVIGPVTDVQQYPAQDMWFVRYHGRPVMIPAAKEFIKKVDLRQRVIVVQNVEGFLEG